VRTIVVQEHRGPQVRITTATGICRLNSGSNCHRDQSSRTKATAPFRRLETSRDRETGGVGLGLPIARDIIRAHGGDISLKNRPEGGLEVIVRPPAVGTTPPT